MAATKENKVVAAKILLRYGCDLDVQSKVTRLMACCIQCEDTHPHFELEPLFLALTHRNVELMTAYLKYCRNVPSAIIQNLFDVLRTSRDLVTHFPSELKQEIIMLYERALKHPRSLQEVCRAVIRESLGSVPQDKIGSTPLADKLHNYVLMTEEINFEDVEKDLSKDECKSSQYGNRFGWAEPDE